jgi:succinate-semialdehyde dehydrogenase / glutarate-semialdehyde dehydrogenase
MKLVSVNPYSEEINQEFEGFDLRRCEQAARRAREALQEWKSLTLADRCGCLERLAGVLRQEHRRSAEIITREMGKPVSQALAEIDKSIRLCHHYIDNSSRYLQEEVVPTEAHKSFISYEPLGVILGIMPWNYPFWQVLRFAVPTLVAGNTCLLKHASNVPMAALAIEQLFRAAGFPEGVFQTLLTDGDTIGRLIEADWVDGVSLTGSFSAGSKVGALAGRGIKKAVLELGGSDPFIVLDDADVACAAEKAVLARTMNTGQSCIAAKRFIVMKSVAASFVERFSAFLNTLGIGDPMLESTDLGPLARREFVADLQTQLEDAILKGGKVIPGPRPPGGKGFFFRPVLVTDVTADMRIVKEEVFGPIAPIIVAADEAEAVALANATEFGLGASIWSRDLDRAERVARCIQAGFVAINSIAKSDPRLPFGGVKKSGVGREMARYGLMEFVNVKTLVIMP